MPIYRERQQYETTDSRGNPLPAGRIGRFIPPSTADEKAYGYGGSIPDAMPIGTALRNYPKRMEAVLGKVNYEGPNALGYRTGALAQPPADSGPLREIWDKIYATGSMYVDENEGKNISTTFSKGGAKYELIANYVPVRLYSGKKNFAIDYALRRIG